MICSARSLNNTCISWHKLANKKTKNHRTEMVGSGNRGPSCYIHVCKNCTHKQSCLNIFFYTNSHRISKEIITEKSWRLLELGSSRRNTFYYKPKLLLVVPIRVTCTGHNGLKRITIRWHELLLLTLKFNLQPTVSLFPATSHICSDYRLTIKT